MLDRVLMVCHGNVCRSPVAEGLLRARFARLGRGVVGSAGLAAVEGAPPDPISVALLSERGIDIAGHRARQLTPDLLARYDLVLVMEDEQRRRIEELSRAARGRVHRIGKFGGFDVKDPYRQPRDAHERALALIQRGLDEFERTFWATGPISSTSTGRAA